MGNAPRFVGVGTGRQHLCPKPELSLVLHVLGLELLLNPHRRFNADIDDMNLPTYHQPSISSEFALRLALKL